VGEASFVKRDLWERGLRFVDNTSGAVPDLVKRFLSTQLNIHCPNFQQNCVSSVGRLIKKRLNGMLHNVTSKYRAKLADMSKYNTVVGFFNATQILTNRLTDFHPSQSKRITIPQKSQLQIL
jgi:hypothetical protein